MHTLAFNSSLAAGAVFLNVNAVPDAHFTIQNNHFIFPANLNCYWAYALGVDLARVRLNWPTLRKLFLPQYRPFDTVGLPPDDPAVLDLMGVYPQVQAGEEIAIEAIQSNVGAQNAIFLLGVDTQKTPAPAGPIYTARATAAITSVANTWTNGILTFDETLPAGQYEIVGAEGIEDAGIAFRFVLPTQLHRPGAPFTTAVGNLADPMFRMGRMGSWGKFVNTALPNIDIMCNASAAQTPVFHIDLIKIG